MKLQVKEYIPRSWWHPIGASILCKEFSARTPSLCNAVTICFTIDKSKFRNPACAWAAGVDRTVSVDLHSGQIQGFFNVPVDHLTATPVLADYLLRHGTSDLVMVSPDAGRVRVAERFSQLLGSDLAFVAKRRPRGSLNEVEALNVVGEVAGRRCVVIDDIIDTAGTVCAAAELLMDHGATEVWAMATHPVLSDPALVRLNKSAISRVVVTNTLPLPEERRIDKIEVLSVARIIADAIDAVFEDTSVSEIFGGHNLT